MWKTGQVVMKDLQPTKVDAVANQIFVKLAQALGGNGVAREGCSFGESLQESLIRTLYKGG